MFYIYFFLFLFFSTLYNRETIAVRQRPYPARVIHAKREPQKSHSFLSVKRASRKKNRENFLDFNNKILKKSITAVPTVALSKAQSSENLLVMLLDKTFEGITKYFHVYQIVWFLMMKTMTTKANIKTFKMDGPIQEFLIQRGEKFCHHIKHLCREFDVIMYQNIVKELTGKVFNYQKNMLYINPESIKIGMSSNYYEKLPVEFIEKLQNKLTPIEESNMVNLFFDAPKKEQDTIAIFIQRIFKMKSDQKTQNKQTNLFLDFIKLLHVVYAYKVGLDSNIILEKEFYGLIAEATENKADVRVNIKYVKDALSFIPQILNDLMLAMDRSQSNNRPAYAAALENKILLIEKNGEVENEKKSNFSTYGKIALAGVAVAGSLFLSSQFGLMNSLFQTPLMNKITASFAQYLPKVTSVYNQATGMLKNGLLNWAANKSLFKMFYELTTFSVGDKVLQTSHSYIANKVLEKIEPQNTALKIGLSLALEKGLQKFDRGFTYYFAKLFGSKGVKYFNTSLFSSLTSKALDFWYKSSVYYIFCIPVEYQTINTSLDLYFAVNRLEYCRGMLLRMIQEEKESILGNIRLVKNVVLDRFIV